MCLKQRNSQLMNFSSSVIVQCEEVKPETPVYILQYKFTKQGTVTVLCEPHSHCLCAFSMFVWSALTSIAQLAQFLQQRPQAACPTPFNAFICPFANVRNKH